MTPRIRAALLALLVLVLGVGGGYAGFRLKVRGQPNRMNALGGGAGSLGGVLQVIGAGVVAPVTWVANSLAPPVYSPAWRVTQGSLAPSVQPFAGVSTAGYATRGLVWINRQIGGANTCPAKGYLERPVTTPVGVTGIQLQWDEVQRDADGASPAFALQVYDAPGLSQISTTSFTPSASSTTVATATVAVVASTEYRVRISCLTGAHFLAGAFRVAPVTSTDARYTSGFARLDVDVSVLQDSNEVGYVNPRYAAQTEFSHVELSTNAPWVIVEAYDNIGDYIGTGANGNDNLSVSINGAPLDPTLAPTVGAVSYSAIALTSGASPSVFRRVGISAGPQSVTGLPAPVLENRGTFIAGIYVPTAFGVSTQVLPADRPASGETIVLYGDSKIAGFYSDVPARDSVAFQLRSLGHRVISNAYGGGSLATDVGTTLSATSAPMVAMATKLCRSQPTQIILEMGRNDFTGGTFSAANLKTQLVNLATALHSQCPSALVKVLTFTHEASGNEVLEGGVSWVTMRGNQIGVCSGLSYCSVLYGDALWTTAEASGFTSDNTHPNSKGHTAIAALIHGVGAFPWTPARLSPTIWCQPDVGLAGSAMGAVTAAGTSPPTVTLSGVPAAALALRIEVKLGGSLGAASFRWSVDGGRSWAAQGVLTGASVALGSTGVTAAFGVGPYTSDNTYTSTSDASGCVDSSGSGNPFVASGGSNPVATLNGVNGLLSLTSTSSTYITQTITIAPPYSWWTVATAASATTTKAILGRPGAATGLLVYSTSGTAMAANAGSQQQAITPAGGLTIAHSYAGIVVGGGSAGSVMCSDPSPLNLCTAFAVAPGTQSITAIAIGYDNGSGAQGNYTIGETGIVGRQLTTDEINSLGAYLRAKYGLSN